MALGCAPVLPNLGPRRPDPDLDHRGVIWHWPDAHGRRPEAAHGCSGRCNAKPWPGLRTAVVAAAQATTPVGASARWPSCRAPVLQRGRSLPPVCAASPWARWRGRRGPEPAPPESSVPSSRVPLPRLGSERPRPVAARPKGRGATSRRDWGGSAVAGQRRSGGRWGGEWLEGRCGARGRAAGCSEAKWISSAAGRRRPGERKPIGYQRILVISYLFLYFCSNMESNTDNVSFCRIRL